MIRAILARQWAWWGCRLLAVLWMLGPAAVGAADGNDIEVKVSVEGEVVRVESSYAVGATPAEVWSVMTDFENMPRFVSNLKSSSVVSRSGDVVVVAQSGEAAYGLLKFAFQSVRELRLIPMRRIESRMISGNLERYEGITELSPEGPNTRVVVRSVAVPDKWVPPVVGPHFIVRETREQLAEFRAEVLRRKAAPGQ